MVEIEFLERLTRYYSSVFPHKVAQNAKVRMGCEDDFEYTYGDTPLQLSKELFQWAGISKHDNFCDLGCGSGIPTLVASSMCESASGVDALPELVEISRQAAQDLNVTNVQFTCQNFLETDLSVFSFVYAYSTCFPKVLMKSLEERFLRMKPGSKILITNHRYQNPDLIPVKEIKQRWTYDEQEWELSTDVLLYRRASAGESYDWMEQYLS